MSTQVVTPSPGQNKESPLSEFGPYCLERILGEGSTGIVYLATNNRGKRFALKLTRAYDMALMESMRREISVMQSIRHPGLVCLEEHGEIHGLPWYSMELLPDDTLREKLEDKTYAPGMLTDSLQLLIRLAEVLMALHSQGYVHGDLKPENIFLRTTTEPVLGDLNLTREGQRGQMTGTPLYTAPEQIRGEPLDARTDLYALGCIAWELFTGSPPFQPGPTLLADHLQKPLPNLKHIRPELSSKLCDTVSRLLEKERNQRFSYAQDLVELLGGGSDVSPSISPPCHLYEPSLIGRQELLRQFQPHAAFDSPGGMVLIEGSRGIGKSALARRVRNLLTDEGWRVVSSDIPAPISLDNPTTEMPLAAFQSVLQAMIDLCWVQGERTVAKLFGAHAERLQLYAQGVAELPGIKVQNLTPIPGQTQRLSILRSLENSLKAFTEEQRLAIILDDLQWADELSLDFLQQLMARVPVAKKLLLVAFFRSENATKLAPLTRQPTVKRLTMAPLTPSDMTSIISEMLTMYPPPVTLNRDLVTLSQGSPLLLIENLRLYVSSGRLQRPPNAPWDYQAESSQSFENSSDPFTNALGARLQRLTPLTRRWAEVLALIGGEADIHLVTAVLAIEDAASYLCLEELIEARVCETTGMSAARFQNGCYREQLLLEWRSNPVPALHAAIATALKELYCLDPSFPTHCSSIAFHLEQAGNRDESIHFHVKAGDFALDRSAYRSAITHYQRALEYNQQSTERTTPSWMEGCWWYRKGLAEYAIEDLKSADASTRNALEKLGVSLPRNRTALLARLGKEALQHVLFSKRPSSVENPELVEDLVQATTFQAERYFIANDAIAMYTMILTAINRGAHLNHPALSEPYTYLGHAAGVLRLHRSAERYFRRSMHLARRSKQSNDIAFVSLGQTLYFIGCGRMNDAIHCAQESLAELDSNMDPLAYENQISSLANISYLVGRFDRAYAYTDTLLSLAEANDNLVRMCWARLYRVRVFLVRGQFERALELLKKTREIAADLEDGFLNLMTPGLSALAYFHLGQREIAEENALACLAQLEQTFPANVFTRDAYMATASTFWKLYQSERNPHRKTQLFASYKRTLKRFRLFARIFPMAKPIYLLYRSFLRNASARASRFCHAVDRISLSALNYDLLIAESYAKELQIELKSGICEETIECAKASGIEHNVAF